MPRRALTEETDITEGKAPYMLAATVMDGQSTHKRSMSVVTATDSRSIAIGRSPHRVTAAIIATEVTALRPIETEEIGTITRDTTDAITREAV